MSHQPFFHIAVLCSEQPSVSIDFSDAVCVFCEYLVFEVKSFFPHCEVHRAESRVDRADNTVSKWVQVRPNIADETFPNKTEEQTTCRPSLKCVRSFPGGVSSSEVAQRMCCVFHRAPPVGFNTAVTTAWHQNKTL